MQFLRVALPVVFQAVLSGQGYVISTVAGGSPPDAAPGLSAGLAAAQRIAVDANGGVFVSDADVVYRLDTRTGILSRIAGDGLPGFSGDNGQAVNARLRGPAGIAVDSSGAVFVSDSANHRIRRISNGVITTVVGNGTAGFGGDNGPATAAQLQYPDGVAVDRAGNLYIADTFNQRVRKVTNGIISTVAGGGSNFPGNGGVPTAARLSNPSGVAVDAAGSLFIAEAGRIRRVAADAISTVAGSGTYGFSGDNGPATAAALSATISSLAIDSSGGIYFAEPDNGRIRRVVNGTITTVAGGGENYPGENGPATGALLDIPRGVAVDPAGIIYISARGTLRRVAGGIITTIAGNGTARFSGDDGPAARAQLNTPRGVAVDAAGALYVSDTYNRRIRKVSEGVITTVAGGGTAFPGDGRPATAVRLSEVFANPVVDGAGDLYIADSDNGLVRKVSAGLITTIAGGGSGDPADGGLATRAAFSSSMNIALDQAGGLYISDGQSQRVFKVTGGNISVVAGNGAQDFGGDGGPATAAQLSYPQGIAIDSSGNLYVADTMNFRIRKISDGVITTIAGNGTAGFAGDGGAATDAQVSEVYGIALDSAGNLYIADRGNRRIRKVSDGIITTIAGDGTEGFGGDGGTAAAASFREPHAVAVDSQGRVYVADSYNHRIRVLTPGVQ